MNFPIAFSPSGRLLVAAAVAFLGAAVAAPPAAAQMYQWVNPNTGRSQLSGTPPSWYRSGQPGPRILVYERGALVDDTELKVSEERATVLRESAFEAVQARQERIAALKRLDDTNRRNQDRDRRDASRKSQTLKTATKDKDDPPLIEPSELRSPLERFGADTIERLKALISEFDRAEPESPSSPEGGSN